MMAALLNVLIIYKYVEKWCGQEMVIANGFISKFPLLCETPSHYNVVNSQLACGHADHGIYDIGILPSKYFISALADKLIRATVSLITSTSK